jgi:hypothetical protein
MPKAQRPVYPVGFNGLVILMSLNVVPSNMNDPDAVPPPANVTPVNV